MSEYTRRSLADYLDSYDDEIAVLQESKREMLQDYRAQLAGKGWGKAQIKGEIDGFKAALRRRRAIAKKGEDEVEQADAVADEIFIEITALAPRATRARENIEEFPPHDAETGELADRDEPEAAAEAAGDYLREPVAAEQGQIIREGDAPRETGRLGGDASCPDAELRPQASSGTSSAGDPSPTPGQRDLVEAGTGQNCAVLPQEPCKAESLHDAFEPENLWLAKPQTALRPHCLVPDNCAGYGAKHCHRCTVAMRESEAA